MAANENYILMLIHVAEIFTFNIEISDVYTKFGLQTVTKAGTAISCFTE